MGNARPRETGMAPMKSVFLPALPASVVLGFVGDLPCGWSAAKKDDSKIVAFDNMQRRWDSATPGEIVLDIPGIAKTIYFCLILDGPGKVWTQNLAFDLVDHPVLTTDKIGTALPAHPVNLDFSA